MWRITFIAREFFRSFQKNLLKDLLLAAIFSISLVMAVLMCSYYFDLGEKYEDMTQQVGDRTWCNLNFLIEENIGISNALATASGCQDMMDYYEALHASEECPIFSLNTQQGLYMRENDVKAFWGDKDYQRVVDKSQNLPITGTFGEDEVCSLLNIQSVQMDWRAYRLFGLKVQEGEGFTEQNLELPQASMPVPILLGSAYKGIIGIGDSMEACFWNDVFSCQVIGILEEGESVPEFGRLDSGTCQLDTAIVFPFGIRLSEPPQSLKESKKFAYLACLALDCGIAQVKDGHINQQANIFYETAKSFGTPAVHLIGTSLGMEFFRKESAASVKMLLILTLALICFAFYGLLVTFYDKVQSNSRTYGIYLMNGCPLPIILVSCLTEAALILFPSVLLGRAVFTYETIGMAYRMDIAIWMVCGFAGLSFLVGAAFIAYLMKGVNTEHFIRQKE